MKIQKVLKFIGDPRGLRICKKTLQLWSNVLDCTLDDIHSTVSVINPNSKPAVAFLRLVFPKATNAAINGMINLNNLHAELFPIAPVEGVTYIAEVSSISIEEVNYIIESLRPTVKFSLENTPGSVHHDGELVQVIFRNGEFKKKKKDKKGLK